MRLDDFFFPECLPSYLRGTNSDSGFFLTHSHEPVSMPHVPTRKPRDKPAPYKPRKRYERQKKDAPKTSAQPVKRTTCENLTLHDWMTVFKFVDERPTMSQVLGISFYYFSVQTFRASVSASVIHC